MYDNKIQLQFYSLPCKYMSTLLRCSVRGNSGIRSKQSLERKDMEWKNVAMLSSPCVCCVTPLSSIWSVKSSRVFEPTPEKEMVSSLLLILCGVVPAYVHSGMHNHIVCICCAFLHCVLQLETVWCHPYLHIYIVECTSAASKS